MKFVQKKHNNLLASFTFLYMKGFGNRLQELWRIIIDILGKIQRKKKSLIILLNYIQIYIFLNLFSKIHINKLCQGIYI